MTSFDWKWKARLILIHKDVRAIQGKKGRLTLVEKGTLDEHKIKIIMFIVLWSFEEGGIKQTNVGGL